jgi:hypothetical protein
LRDYETIVNLISKTTTAKGLKVTCRLDRRKYPTGRKVTNQEMEHVRRAPVIFRIAPIIYLLFSIVILAGLISSRRQRSKQDDYAA